MSKQSEITCARDKGVVFHNIGQALSGSNDRRPNVTNWVLIQTPRVFCPCFVWFPCMAINVSVQYNGGLLSNIILLTQCYYHRGTRVNAMKRYCLCRLWSHLNVLTFFPPDWGVLRGSIDGFVFLLKYIYTLKNFPGYSTSKVCRAVRVTQFYFLFDKGLFLPLAVLHRLCRFSLYPIFICQRSLHFSTIFI